MTTSERRSTLSLASIYALRMLGLFLVLPVFTLAAHEYRGGEDDLLVGFAMGVYGLTQAILLLPLGIASDRFGRKPIILLGLTFFAAGSVFAALSDSVWGLIFSRALQGAGAVSAAVAALLADQTRDCVRTKAMAIVGICIGTMFSLALVLGPYLGARIGLSGLFWLTAFLAVMGMFTVLWLVPAESSTHVQAQHHADQTLMGELEQAASQAWWRSSAIWRLNFGVFALHILQMSLWSAVPMLLLQSGLERAQHWHLYLPVVLSSILFLGAIMALERRGFSTLAMCISICLVFFSQLGLMYLSVQQQPSVLSLSVVLFIFFCGVNALGAIQPSLASRISPPNARGASLGVYSTLQSLGLFIGGLVGGWAVKNYGASGLFISTSCLAGIWLILNWNLNPNLPNVAGKTNQ